MDLLTLAMWVGTIIFLIFSFAKDKKKTKQALKTTDKTVDHEKLMHAISSCPVKAIFTLLTGDEEIRSSHTYSFLHISDIA